MQYIVEEDKLFKQKIEEYEKSWPRMKEFRAGLHKLLSRNPFEWGTPIPRQEHWKYGAYFVATSDKVGKYPRFDVFYRVDDDHVYLLNFTGIVM